MIRFRRSILAIPVTLACFNFAMPQLFACTGITLRAKDGSVVFGRTLEWGSFDLRSRIVVVPRGYEFKAQTPDGKPGHTWKGTYGAVGLDVVGKDFIVDGMNEKGLAVNVFYHPGYAEYARYEPAKAAATLSSLDVCQFLLTTCATVEDVKTAIASMQVVGMLLPEIGIEPPIHLIATEPSGKAIVIEFTKGETKIVDAPLGVITNAPNYDWHITNLRNYINLSPLGLPDKNVEDIAFKPLGGGTGMLGLPGDYTPPSRFIRAVAFSKSARPTDTGAETMYEVFRILDNFNVPLGAAEGEGEMKLQGLRSSTCWTTAYDTKDMVLDYHTQHNRRVRQIDLKKIDFGKSGGLLRMPLDKQQKQDIEDVTPLMK